MDMEYFNKLKEIIKENYDLVDVGTGASSALIKEAEDILGLTFPDDYRKFLSTWGTLSIGPFEYYGITGTDFINSSVPNGIWFTKIKREQLKLPKNLVILSDNNGDQYLCLEISKEGSTYELIYWDVLTRERMEIKSKNLFEYILDEIEDFV